MSFYSLLRRGSSGLGVPDPPGLQEHPGVLKGTGWSDSNLRRCFPWSPTVPEGPATWPESVHVPSVVEEEVTANDSCPKGLSRRETR